MAKKKPSKVEETALILAQAYNEKKRTAAEYTAACKAVLAARKEYEKAIEEANQEAKQSA